MEKSPFIGQMDRKIRFCTVEDVRNSIGEVKPVETLLCEPFARFEDLKTNSSDAEYTDGKVMHIMDAAFTIRYRPDIHRDGHSMVLVYEGRKYRIEHASEIGRRRHLKIFCKNYE